KKWIPVYLTIILLALAGASIFQYFFYRNFSAGLTPFLDWKVFAIAFLLMLLCVIINYVIIKKLLQNLHQ
ncbi:MAG TPA: hypothetical protein VK489_04490, partial [Ferruginibacter sp.]|nr:hypothetical protein [Ferruginibacter sp.]